MELKSYVEGLLRKWWLLGLVLALSLWIGGIIASTQQNEYTATTTVLLNSQLITSMADPSGVVQLTVPTSPGSQVATPAILTTIIKHYPRLSRSDLKKNIVVTSDTLDNFLLISVTDISPASATDIANFLAQQFVDKYTNNLRLQLSYFQGWLQQSISRLNTEINKLNSEVQSLTPPPLPRSEATPITPAAQQTIRLDEFQLYLDERDLYRYQQATQDVQNTSPLIPKVYLIMQPATVSSQPTTSALPTLDIEMIAAGVGLFVGICLFITMEYFSPFVRHKGELQRVVGLPVLAEVPHLYYYEQKRLLESRPLFFRRKSDALKLLCATIGAPANKVRGHTILLTSARKKRNFAVILARLLTAAGHQTLLIEADFRDPSLHKRINPLGPCDLVTSHGQRLSFIKTAAKTHFYVLPAATLLSQNDLLAPSNLIELLPELQQTFSIIIIDAPPLDRADTRLIATKVTQTALLVKKRREALKQLKVAKKICEELKLNVYSLLLD